MGLELEQAQVAALEARTEGWAAGLQLAALWRLGYRIMAALPGEPLRSRCDPTHDQLMCARRLLARLGSSLRASTCPSEHPSVRVSAANH